MSLALVRTDIAPLFTRPTTDCELGDEALYGMVVEVRDTQGSWREVTTHYRYGGYAPEDCLLEDPELVSRWQRLPKAVVRAPYADVLRGPKVQESRLACVPRGGLLSPVGEPEEGWQRVRLVDGREGFIMAGHLGEHRTAWFREEEAALRAALVETALSYLGTQYRWGGKTPLGIDCSGLTSMAYMLNGILIYRDAHIKPEFALREIDPGEVKPGDLLFFPGHVALYMGEGKYVHSTAKAGSDGVVINSLRPEDPDYREDLVEKITAAGSIFQ